MVQDVERGYEGALLLQRPINSVTVSPKEKKIGFNYDDFYAIDATFSDGLEKLTITMREQYETKRSGSATELQLVYSPPSAQHHHAGMDAYGSVEPRIYLGKLTNWAPYAIDELLVIVAPKGMDDGNAICAFWQWTMTASGAKKVNVNDIRTISDAKNVTDVGESFRFYQGDNYYTYDVTVQESKEQLIFTMRNPGGESTGDLTLDRKDLHPASARSQRAIFNHTTTVRNDASEIVTCSLKASGTGLTDQIIATASLLIGGVGLVATLPSGLPMAVGVYLAAIGWHVAVGGMVQVFNASGEDTSAVMFPGDTMTRSSSGSIITSNNDLHLIVVRVDSLNRRLIVSTATIEKAGDTTLDLSALLPDSPRSTVRPSYKQLLTIDLPSDMRLISYRNVKIPGLKMTHDAKETKDMKEDDIPNAVATFQTSTSSSKWYGTLDGYYDAVKTTKDWKMFSYDEDFGSTFSQDVSGTGGSHAKVFAIAVHGGKELIVLKLTNCLVEGAPCSLNLLNALS